MNIRFLGAVRTTTGSMHLLNANGRYVLLDCGLYQGRRKQAFERNRHLPFDPRMLDAVVLSHAHIDHSGNLPSLVRRGYEGPVYATPATIDLCDIMLKDSAYLQKRDVEYVNKRRKRQGKKPFEPLYEAEDVDRLMKLFEPVDYEADADLGGGFSIRYHDAGHILGSAVTEIHVAEDGSTHKILFTGDLGRPDMPILKDPVAVEGCDTLITESTYGNKLHPARKDVQAELRGLVQDICASKGKLVIPSFSVGRTQQLVYFLDDLHNNGEIPELPVYVDSPLSTKATEVHKRHPECFDAGALDRLHSGETPFAFHRLRYITDVEDSKALNYQDGPMVIISASGMCEGGRIVHHLRNNLGNPRNIILFVGFQAEHTLGRRIIEGRKPIRMFGEEVKVRARIKSIRALSAHADRKELLDYVRQIQASLERVFVVHGEEEKSLALADGLREQGCPDVLVPVPGQEVGF